MKIAMNISWAVICLAALKLAEDRLESMGAPKHLLVTWILILFVAAAAGFFVINSDPEDNQE